MRRVPLDWKIYYVTARPQDAFKPCIRLPEMFLQIYTAYERVFYIIEDEWKHEIQDSDFYNFDVTGFMMGVI